MGSTKDKDFNDFIDVKTPFHDIKSKKIRFEVYKKVKWNLNRNYLVKEQELKIK